MGAIIRAPLSEFEKIGIELEEQMRELYVDSYWVGFSDSYESVNFKGKFYLKRIEFIIFPFTGGSANIFRIKIDSQIPNLQAFYKNKLNINQM